MYINIDMYIHVNNFKIYTVCVRVFIYIHNKYTQNAHIYYANNTFYFVSDSLFDST